MQEGWLPRIAVILQGYTPTSGEAPATDVVVAYTFGFGSWRNAGGSVLRCLRVKELGRAKTAVFSGGDRSYGAILDGSQSRDCHATNQISRAQNGGVFVALMRTLKARLTPISERTDYT